MPTEQDRMDSTDYNTTAWKEKAICSLCQGSKRCDKHGRITEPIDSGSMAWENGRREPDLDVVLVRRSEFGHGNEYLQISI
jgi:hypothetical protein